MTKLSRCTRIVMMIAMAVLGILLPSRHAWAQG
jgi:hypothetical protein